MTKRKEHIKGTSVGDLMSMKETASYLNITERTLLTWMQKGRIAYYKIGRPNLFKLSDLEVFVESKRVESRK